MDMFEKLSLAGLVPVIKVEDARDAVPLCQALADGGLPVAEITFRTKAAADAIAAVHKALPQVLLGAGTVLTTEQVDQAMEAGAGYIVSPGLNPDVVRHCQQKNIPVLPGCASPSDIEMALSLGLQTVKFFPAEAVGGLPLIKALAGPYVDVRFVPTGGINEKNLLDYLSFPKVVACGGSWMVPDAAVREQDWAHIRTLTSSAVMHMLGFELAHLGINSRDEDEAITTAELLAALLGRSLRIGNSSIFAGADFEVMKNPGRGTHGHIGIRTNSLRRARAYLERSGYRFVESSLTEKEGRPVAIYMDGEIGGFAVHLLQK